MSVRAPADCNDLAQVRVEIDRIDNKLVDVIAERLGYVERAWQIKLQMKQEANVPWRNQQVIDKVRARAVEKGVLRGYHNIESIAVEFFADLIKR